MVREEGVVVSPDDGVQVDAVAGGMVRADQGAGLHWLARGCW